MSAEAKQHWEERYSTRVWSGRPNARLVEVVSELTPGDALDLGSGEGGDAIWLASRGWRVLAVDLSETAVRRAAEDARARGAGERIEFRQFDLTAGFPEGEFDLVNAQFLHSTFPLDRTPIFRAAAGAVRPGGMLLIVDHAGPPPWHSELEGHAHTFVAPEEVVAALELPAAQWEPAEIRSAPREVTTPDGDTATWFDNVMVLRRRAYTSGV
ncbi:methyltransferase family protein [Mycolicibacterium phlei]|jgi:SAM-dependent methyltransferase|uniref:class I SAM-dependent methyltransferase n=1 Tax=Mycolicibacterium phlei TaxID=1771 RepID=UPI0005902652|nr:class I SAM-dependent methyltransferase [Mycolicibacterium phlei]AMO62173.1 Sarcosine/dimethylglycine N-methyltransferase [Mycolicibacterium phlei]KXW74982.1 SAM-dependent methlyltransferase [Mycolicibacterium phlei DSM 43071]STZ20149.1 methyltransferase family protein [Mycolicibacterium phlei]VEG10278.1 methyltransferase family protein [Mycobacteroides chelonae]